MTKIKGLTTEKRMGFKIDKELSDRLDIMTDITGYSRSEIVRRLVASVMKRATAIEQSPLFLKTDASVLAASSLQSDEERVLSFRGDRKTINDLAYLTEMTGLSQGEIVRRLIYNAMVLAPSIETKPEALFRRVDDTKEIRRRQALALMTPGASPEAETIKRRIKEERKEETLITA